MPNEPHGALLVGSVPLSTAEDVFRAAAECLGSHLKRVPDGETGDRAGWVAWQGRSFKLPQLELVKPAPGQYPPTPRFRPKDPSVDLAALDFPELGFAEAALASYPVFSRLKHAGVLRNDLRFQVSLPTPLAPVAMFIVDEHQAAVAPVYEAKLHEDIDRILEFIPHDQLAIQWDICIEVWMWERWLHSPFADVEETLVESVARIGGWLPPDVELGHHYCYGDFMHEHFRQPENLRVLTEMVSRMAQRTPRLVNWVHLPIPIERDDDAFFAPLDQLDLDAETEIHLGLIHMRDGVEGAQRRIQAALSHIQTFGVACECGLGRRPVGRGGDEPGLRQLLQIHADVSAPVLS